MSSSPVIQVENLSKYYRLGLIGGGTLNEDINRWIAKMRGKPDPLLKLGEIDHGIRKDGQIWALKDVSLEVNEGEILGIIGRNGAGKSTLLKILSKITAPTEGRIKIKGRVGSLLEVGTGFHPELTGRENIYLNGTILGMSRAEVSSKLDEIIEFAEMLKFIDTPVKRYSSGMRVRLAFSVAAHLEPEILIVDEVLAVGDIAFQRKCIGKMSDISGAGRTVLFVSHNMSTIDRLCSAALLLKDGIVVKRGDVSDVINEYISTKDVIKNIYKQPHNSEKHINIRQVFLRNIEKECIQEIRFDEDFEIVIEYEINNAIESGAVSIAIITQSEVILMASAEYDTNEKILGHRRPGKFRASVTIQGKMLNVGNYTVRVFSANALKSKAYDRIDAISFSIIGTGTHFGVGKRAAHLVPVLNWQTLEI